MAVTVTKLETQNLGSVNLYVFKVVDSDGGAVDCFTGLSQITCAWQVNITGTTSNNDLGVTSSGGTVTFGSKTPNATTRTIAVIGR